MLGFYGDAKPYLDLVLVHFPFAVKPECMGPAGPGCEVPFYDPGREVRRETWAAMEFVKRMGRARAIGVSNYKVEHFMARGPRLCGSDEVMVDFIGFLRRSWTCRRSRL